MNRIPVTAEELFFNGTARFAGPDKQMFRIHSRKTRSHKCETLYTLGIYYLHGYGCKQCLATARELFKQASNRKHSSASYMLFLIYRNSGQITEAMTFLNAAARQGHAVAKRLVLARPSPFAIFLRRRCVEPAIPAREGCPAIER